MWSPVTGVARPHTQEGESNSECSETLMRCVEVIFEVFISSSNVHFCSSTVAKLKVLHGSGLVGVVVPVSINSLSTLNHVRGFDNYRVVVSI